MKAHPSPLNEPLPADQGLRLRRAEKRQAANRRRSESHLQLELDLPIVEIRQTVRTIRVRTVGWIPERYIVSVAWTQLRTAAQIRGIRLEIGVVEQISDIGLKIDRHPFCHPKASLESEVQIVDARASDTTVVDRRTSQPVSIVDVLPGCHGTRYDRGHEGIRVEPQERVVRRSNDPAIRQGHGSFAVIPVLIDLGKNQRLIRRPVGAGIERAGGVVVEVKRVATFVHFHGAEGPAAHQE